MKKYSSPEDILKPVVNTHIPSDRAPSSYPDDALETLEYPEMIRLLKSFASGAPAERIVARYCPSTELHWIEERLDETAEMKSMLDEGHSVPIGEYLDISDDLYKLQVSGYRLEIERILNLFTVIDQLEGLRRSKDRLPIALHAPIQKYWQKFPDLSGLLKSIMKIFDRDGNVRSDASPRLIELAEKQRSIRQSMESTFQSILKAYRKKGWLSDAPETIRNGRKVLSVPSEHKDKIEGIVHDQSSSGKTTYIEPQELIRSNNKLFQLENDKKREIFRLISGLCDHFRTMLPDLVDAYRRLVSLDLILAKARMAQKIEANRPNLQEEPVLLMEQAIHPVLYLHHLETDRPTIPSDISLFGGNRILLLSGPNAGGKSVALKTAGLLQLMIQSGWLVPADENSTFGIFHKFHIDVGDQQSIADDLSTYSSHLSNLKYFLEEADDKTLLLLDELGAGTDPKLGGAIAESILHALKNKGVYGVVTTHYSNLKVYAHHVKGIVNGALAFDQDQLKPIYELRIGKPGSSYAFELAEQNGIPKDIIDRAKEHVGEDLTAVEDLVVQLQNEKKALEEKLKYTEELENQLDRMRKNFDHLHREMEIRRKKLELKNKELNMRDKGDARRQLEEKIREWSKAERLERAREEARKMKEEQQELGEDVNEIKEELFEDEESAERVWQKGDNVKTRDGSFTGKIESIQKGKAVVISGAIKLTVPLRDLRSAGEPLERKKQSSVNTKLSRQAGSMGHKLDLRGLRRKEALKIFEKFMEDALMANKSQLKIIHGRGEGVLRKAIHEKIREYGSEHKLTHPDEEHGGDGVTFVELH